MHRAFISARFHADLAGDAPSEADAGGSEFERVFESDGVALRQVGAPKRPDEVRMQGGQRGRETNRDWAESR